jgi:enoyl-CoA hydratase/carnithine racemase
VSDTNESGLIVERIRGVTKFTLNRPRRKNAVTPEGWVAFRDAIRNINPSQDRVLVITGAGGDFCAGADLGEMNDRSHDAERMREVAQACLALHHVPIPTIAAVDGVAVGAGMNLALSCDFVIATDRVRFCQIFVHRGLSVDFGGSWLLPRLVGLAKAKDLVLLGEFLDASDAFGLGLVREIVAPDHLMETSYALAHRLRSHSQTAIMRSKSLLQGSLEISLERALANEGSAQVVNLSSPDVQEALTAFAERRPASFYPGR